MINTLVTIVIPSNNSLNELKTTINSILLQTKIKGTRVLVLDYGSKDGSFQYVSQASSEFFKNLKIECLDFNKKDAKIEVYTPYVFFITPGYAINDNDLLMYSLNYSFNVDKNYIFIKKSKNIIRRFFPYYFTNKDRKDIIGVICNSKQIDLIKNEKSGDLFNFSIDDDLTKDRYLITSI